MENQLRVKKSALNLVDGKFFYKEELFTGVVFDEKDEFIVAANFVEQGVVTGEYQNGFFDIPIDALLMTEDNPLLEWSDYSDYLPQVKHDGKFVNGAYYEFHGDFCGKEVQIINGWEEIELTWHNNGALNMYFNWSGPQPHVGGGFSFDDTDQLTSFSVGKGEKLHLSVEFSGEYKIKKLSLNKGFFSAKNDFTDNLPFQFVTDLPDLLEYRSGEDIWFSENGISAELFELLFSNGFFAETREMHFFNTAISHRQVEKIALIPELRKIKIHDFHGTLGSAMQKLKRERPEVRVEYEFELKQVEQK